MKSGHSVKEKIEVREKKLFEHEYNRGEKDYFTMMSVKDRIRVIEEK